MLIFYNKCIGFYYYIYKVIHPSSCLLDDTPRENPFVYNNRMGFFQGVSASRRKFYLSIGQECSMLSSGFLYFYGKNQNIRIGSFEIKKGAGFYYYIINI